MGIPLVSFLFSVQPKKFKNLYDTIAIWDISYIFPAMGRISAVAYACLLHLHVTTTLCPQKHSMWPNLAFKRSQEKDLWIYLDQPLILTKWSPNMSLSKDKVTKVPVWVKIHKVPVVAYSEDGLSLIATQIGKPIMLDTFTSAMCAEPWGRIGFARALIEVTAEKELKQEVTMAVPIVEGDGHTMERMNIEYEWKPSRCRDCKIFGHADDQCPKRVKEPVMETPTIQNDGFTMVQNQKKKGKETTNTQTDKADGFKVNKNTPKHVWNIKSKKPVPKPTGDSSKLVNTNAFEALNDMKSGNEMGVPVNYLGVPLISSRLLNKDCKSQFEKPQQDWGWKNKSIFVYRKLQLWVSYGVMVNTSVVKQKWLGMIFAFLKKKEVLDYAALRNGMNTSLWYDMWSTHCPLSKLPSPRDITREGYSIHTCVADLIVNGAWNWPLSWLAKAPTYYGYNEQKFEDCNDKLRQWDVEPATDLDRHDDTIAIWDISYIFPAMGRISAVAYACLLHLHVTTTLCPQKHFPKWSVHAIKLST
ncbi:trichome birefringence-like protein 3 [Tanacetum coccineum]